jgi:hypothetical protein
MKSVRRKLEFRRVTISWMMSRLSGFDWAATNERIEKQRKASVMEGVASAESFRPVKGSVMYWERNPFHPYKGTRERRKAPFHLIRCV